jgi:hypothetical protein
MRRIYSPFSRTILDEDAMTREFERIHGTRVGFRLLDIYKTCQGKPSYPKADQFTGKARKGGYNERVIADFLILQEAYN